MGLIEQTNSRLHFFRGMHLWPIEKELDFENWLENFKEGEERELAAQILNSFVYIPDNIVNQLLRTVVGRCGYYFSRIDPTWTHDSFKDNCWYSFVRGEARQDVTDSGYIFPRKLRDELNIPYNRILSSEDLYEMLENNSAHPQNVILVDDFVGSGLQTDSAWNTHKLGRRGMTLKELVQLYNHHIIYAPLVANETGLEHIKDTCPNLHMECVYKLGREYNLLNVDGLCWSGDKDKFMKFHNLMQQVAINERIPQESGNNENDIFGFHLQGLAIAFNHGIPDACPSFFYWNSATWKPLKMRSYHR